MTSLDIIRLNRSEGIGSSDAKRIIDGDWHQLYLEKVGLADPVDLSGVFRVQLGTYTESFHLDWLERSLGPIERPDHRHYATDHRHMFAHLDGWLPVGKFVEVKHSSSRATAREKAGYYMPQLQHNMHVTGCDEGVFSVIAGNDEPEWVIVERNEEYIDKLVELEASFWWHVTERVPPEIVPTGTLAEVQRIGKATRIDGLRVYDMAGSNEWASLAIDYTETKAAAARFEEAKAGLKKLVPKDASECTGHGLTIKRDKRGSLRFA